MAKRNPNKEYISDLKHCKAKIVDLFSVLQKQKQALSQELKHLTKTIRQNKDFIALDRLKGEQRLISKKLDKLTYQMKRLEQHHLYLRAEIYVWEGAQALATPKVYLMKKHPLTWNYRLLAHQNAKGLQYRVHEVWYIDKEPCHYVEVKGFDAWQEQEEYKAIERKMNAMKNAVLKPILWAGEQFPNEYNS